MAISLRTLKTANLFSPNEIFNLRKVSLPEGDDLPQVGAYAVQARRSDWMDPHEEMLATCCKRMLPVLRSEWFARQFSLRLFAAVRCWRDIKHYRMRGKNAWSFVPQEVRALAINPSAFAMLRGVETLLVGEAAFPVDSIGTIAEFSRTNRSCMPFAWRTEAALDHQLLTSKAEQILPTDRKGRPTSSIHWAAAAAAGRLDCLLFRVSGAFDDRDVGIDLLGRPERIAQIGAEFPPFEWREQA